MVPFDHIAVMRIFGLNAADTLRLQISLLGTMESNGGDFCTPVGCIRRGAESSKARGLTSGAFSLRHGRACPGHPRLCRPKKQDVDARDKRGHDEAMDSFRQNEWLAPLGERAQ